MSRFVDDRLGPLLVNIGETAEMPFDYLRLLASLESYLHSGLRNAKLILSNSHPRIDSISLHKILEWNKIESDILGLDVWEIISTGFPKNAQVRNQSTSFQ